MALGCVDNLFNSCRPCIPQAVSQFASDQRERVAKLSSKEILALGSLGTTAAGLLSIKVITTGSFFLIANPPLAVVTALVGIAASGFFLAYLTSTSIPNRLNASAEQDFVALCEKGWIEQDLSIEDEARINSIANTFRVGRLIEVAGTVGLVSSGFFAAMYLLSSVSPIGPAVSAGFYLAVTIAVLSKTPSSQGESKSIEEAYRVALNNKMDTAMTAKIFKIYISYFKLLAEGSSFNFIARYIGTSNNLIYAVKDHVTPKEMRENFTVFSSMFSDFSINRPLGELFKFALFDEVFEDAELRADSALIQKAAEEAVSRLKSMASTRDSVRSYANFNVETSRKELTAYREFLERTGNLTEGLIAEITEVQGLLDSLRRL